MILVTLQQLCCGSAVCSTRPSPWQTECARSPIASQRRGRFFNAITDHIQWCFYFALFYAYVTLAILMVSFTQCTRLKSTTLLKEFQRSIIKLLAHYTLGDLGFSVLDSYSIWISSTEKSLVSLTYVPLSHLRMFEVPQQSQLFLNCFCFCQCLTNPVSIWGHIPQCSILLWLAQCIGSSLESVAERTLIKSIVILTIHSLIS